MSALSFILFQIFELLISFVGMDGLLCLSVTGSPGTYTMGQAHNNIIVSALFYVDGNSGIKPTSDGLQREICCRKLIHH